MSVADATKAADAILGVIAVASSNFPSSTDINIRALGGNSASVSVAYYDFKRLVEAGRKALQQESQ